MQRIVFYSIEVRSSANCERTAERGQIGSRIIIALAIIIGHYFRQ